MAGKTSKKGSYVLRHLLAAVVLVVALIAGAMIFLNLVTQHGKEIAVPDFSNMTVDEAELAASEAGMRVEVTDSVFVKRMKRGAVYRQNPVPGSKVKEGRRVVLTINAVNAKTVTMPDLVGLSLRQASAEIMSRGLVLNRLIYVQDMATNNVLRQLMGNREVEAGAMVDSESPIDLVLGLNDMDNRTYVPDVSGLKNLSAVEAVFDHSLNVKGLRFDDTVKDYDDSLNAMVYRQVPEPSDSVSVAMGEEVMLYLTTDASKIPVKAEENE
jgi:beta-lactam-binding protein with PASTA domain